MHIKHGPAICPVSRVEAPTGSELRLWKNGFAARGTPQGALLVTGQPVWPAQAARVTGPRGKPGLRARSGARGGRREAGDEPSGDGR
ncbi:hypothetical protein [Paludibacterium paludis]|uniref:Uncharacterized protein n=1 Tax=Paludibacterium paludis TaxID=1225769 RepID=A0A918NXY8_9NEIS|nr:hypothetical protein [Paludibacterium paludis]GGY05946.1 hypothetical protein GCM10011289_05450 [Paludibacterium paludis]